MKRKVISYLIYFAVAAALVLGICGLNGAYTDVVKIDVIRHVCDAFFITGALYLCFAGLAFSSNQGVFDGLTYSVSTIFKTRMPQGKYEYKGSEDFSDYKERKHSEEKRRHPKPLVIIGSVFFAVSLILLIVYYTM